MDFAKPMFFHFAHAAPKGMDAEKLFLNLMHRYTEPHRFYHNVFHIESCLNEMVNASKGEGSLDPAAVLALFYHDAVYTGNPGDDEAASAGLFCDLFPWNQLTQDAATMIAFTAEYHKRGSFGLMGDCDLAGLGKSWAEYEDNGKKIRKEYHQMTDAEWHEGRIRWLEAMLALPYIFNTPSFREKYEATAHRNLGMELGILYKDRT